MKTIIMAGGKGTRIASVASDIPKPMICIEGKPILQYQIECLARNGLRDIIIITGHLGHSITEYFGNGKRFGVNISYYEEPIPLGTAGALFKIYDMLSENFIVLCGDVIFDVDFSRIIKFHHKKKAAATLVSHPNSHPYDSSLLITNKESRIISWLNKEDKRTFYKNEVNAGIHILTKMLLNKTNHEKEKIDLDRDILKPNINSNEIFAYKTPEYIKDMGTPDRYEQVSCDIRKGLVAQKNLREKQRAVFLDRDGTINEASGFVRRPEDLTLIDGAAQAIRKINQRGFLAIVITNQPVIARGEITIDELDEIHKKLETELGKYGAYLDDIYYCPHHPEKGFADERPEYKIECECRKPKPGMIFAAAKKYNIELAGSWMAGDSWRDIEAGLAAGCRTVFLPGLEKPPARAALICKNLAEFAEREL
jgi:D-glycero-D-manno-heptose 1,7-bisphosphate phosphatase